MGSLLYLVARSLVRLLVRTGQRGREDRSKDLEILVLRHQLRVLQRTAGRPKLRTMNRMLLAAASRAIPRDRWVAFLVTAATLLRWHRELVRRKWTYRRTGRPGRPPIEPEVRALILGLARDNPRWGCVRIEGELRKLGLHVSATTIRTMLRTARLGRDDPGRVPRLDAYPRSAASRSDAADLCRALQPAATHRAVGLAPPLADAPVSVTVNPRDVRRRDQLGGLIHEYHGAAA